MIYRTRLHSPLLRYGAAVGAVVIAFLLSFAFPRSAGNESPYFLFCAALLASVVLGGIGPGLLATALSALGSSYFFLQQLGSFHPTLKIVEWLCLFLLEGAAIVLVGRRLTRTPAKPEESVLVRYGAALLFVGLAVALKVTLFPSLQVYLPFRFFLAAVVAAAWYGGLGPGLVATGLSILAAGRLFPLPPDTVASNDMRRTLFGLEAILLCLLTVSRRWVYRETENRLKRLSSESPVGIMFASPEMRILIANPAVCHMLEYDELALRELELPAILHPSSRERFSQSFQSLAQRSVQSIQTDEQFLTRTGQPGCAVFHGWVIDEAPGSRPTCLLLVEDVTQRRRTEEALRESEKRLIVAEKMEAIGLLAAGVAHDFNNLVTVMLGYSEQILASAGDDAQLRHGAGAIRDAARRAADLTGQLLAFSRMQPRKTELLDVSSVVRSMTDLLNGLLAPKVQLTTMLDSGQDHVRADRSQVEQILVNLVTNARDAMPHGGQVMIQTETAELWDGVMPIAEMPIGRYVLLTVRDTGQGMDKATAARIFEPFFTTKERGRGTGLGLACVYGVVKQSGGYITVDSAPDHGTSFTIYLPAAGGGSADQRDVMQ
jgi:PAS domain S-box-containing protein